MKDFINRVLRDYAVVVIFASIGYHIFGHGNAFSISFLFQLLVTLLLTKLLELLIIKFIPDSDYPILEPLFVYIVSMTIILSSWRIFGWYEHVAVWIVAISVTAIFVTNYILDFSKEKQDVAYINEQLQQRRDKKNERIK